ncbi:hypothetical protein [Roseovarius sp.]|uniref:hypothetical protein n=1 Tax=Roseovarius sp. TaxID=1486281 RepID=UPI0035171255
MKKLFEAIKSQHSDCEVVDVRFLVDQYEVANQDVDVLDGALAQAVMEAEYIETPFV